VRSDRYINRSEAKPQPETTESWPDRIIVDWCPSIAFRIILFRHDSVCFVLLLCKRFSQAASKLMDCSAVGQRLNHRADGSNLPTFFVLYQYFRQTAGFGHSIGQFLAIRNTPEPKRPSSPHNGKSVEYWNIGASG
jgi:hypothetical protein